uniref:Molybdenum cofactor sulfurase middle domain-containing protein n=1 Tax=Aegilops tauschii subsp. strangulata TaxID=200361 RepID=A0A453LN49_AEGTS
MDTLKVPLVAERATLDDVSVWEWSGSAYDEGAEAAEWLSSYFGKPSRLVRFKEGVYLVVFFNSHKKYLGCLSICSENVFSIRSSMVLSENVCFYVFGRVRNQAD